jgi:hypothetical protein
MRSNQSIGAGAFLLLMIAAPQLVAQCGTNPESVTVWCDICQQYTTARICGAPGAPCRYCESDFRECCPNGDIVEADFSYSDCQACSGIAARSVKSIPPALAARVYIPSCQGGLVPVAPQASTRSRAQAAKPKTVSARASRKS